MKTNAVYFSCSILVLFLNSCSSPEIKIDINKENVDLFKELLNSMASTNLIYNYVIPISAAIIILILGLFLIIKYLAYPVFKDKKDVFDCQNILYNDIKKENYDLKSKLKRIEDGVYLLGRTLRTKYDCDSETLIKRIREEANELQKEIVSKNKEATEVIIEKENHIKKIEEQMSQISDEKVKIEKLELESIDLKRQIVALQQTRENNEMIISQMDGMTSSAIDASGIMLSTGLNSFQSSMMVCAKCGIPIITTGLARKLENPQYCLKCRSNI